MKTLITTATPATLRGLSADQLEMALKTSRSEKKILSTTLARLESKISALHERRNGVNKEIKTLSHEEDLIFEARFLLHLPERIRAITDMIAAIAELREKSKDDNATLKEVREWCAEKEALEKRIRDTCEHPVVLFYDGNYGSSINDFDDAYPEVRRCPLCGVRETTPATGYGQYPQAPQYKALADDPYRLIKRDYTRDKTMRGAGAEPFEPLYEALWNSLGTWTRNLIWPKGS